MSTQPIDAAEPVVVQRSGVSLVWLIPALTLMIGGWLTIKALNERGPQATIVFGAADGIEAGRTRVKYKTVDVGIVEKVQLTEDFSQVEALVRFEPSAVDMLRRNTRFWIVRPELTLRGARGLETLLAGAYIEIDPGPGAPQQRFNGLPRRPVVNAEEPGTQIMLSTESLGALDAGSPVYYRGIVAGEVLGYELGGDRQTVFLPVFVRAPYDQLLRGHSRFWNVSGMSLSVGSGGPQVEIESVLSLLYGGIAFDTPPSLTPGGEDVSRLVFPLHEDRRAALAQQAARSIRYVLYFDESVRGLSPGAAVEVRGIRVGEVLEVRLQLDSDAQDFLVPVLIAIEPERILAGAGADTLNPSELMDQLVEKGLRGQLQKSSFITSALHVELGMHPDEPPRWRGDSALAYPELPTVPGSLDALLQTAERFAEKLDSVDVASIAANLDGTLAASKELIGSPELIGSIEQLRELLAGLNRANLDQTIVAATEVLMGVEQILKPTSPLQFGLIRTADELEKTARSLRDLLDLLQQRPEALVFGRKKEKAK